MTTDAHLLELGDGEHLLLGVSGELCRRISKGDLQASRLLMPPTSTSRRILVHLSMSVITHFPRDPEHWVTCTDRSINTSLAHNQRDRGMSAALSKRCDGRNGRCTFGPAFTPLDSRIP
jgi:hypothetical protein